jgi:hypothetical protein
MYRQIQALDYPVTLMKMKERRCKDKRINIEWRMRRRR